MNRLHQIIDQQIEFNQGKNLFLSDSAHYLKFTHEMVAAIKDIGSHDAAEEHELIDYVTQKSFQEFCRINQYFSINKQAKADLRNIYADLFGNIRNHHTSVEEISLVHYDKLKQWLLKTNTHIDDIYSAKGQRLEPVACSEYSADLQLALLQLDTSRIKEPVLDIGCGKQGNLVHYLSSMGIEAIGFDRFSFDDSDLIEADWLSFDYGTEQWGTIVSNLGFSNHFNHHHLREDGDFIKYAKKFMDILNALKMGGSFHYAPDLPFIEKYLDPTKYQLLNQDLGISKYRATIITRLG